MKQIAKAYGFTVVDREPGGPGLHGVFEGLEIEAWSPAPGDPPGWVYRAIGVPPELEIIPRSGAGDTDDRVVIGHDRFDRLAVVRGPPVLAFAALTPRVRAALIPILRVGGRVSGGTIELTRQAHPWTPQDVRAHFSALYEAGHPMQELGLDPVDGIHQTIRHDEEAGVAGNALHAVATSDEVPPDRRRAILEEGLDSPHLRVRLLAAHHLQEGETLRRLACTAEDAEVRQAGLRALRASWAAPYLQSALAELLDDPRTEARVDGIGAAILADPAVAASLVDDYHRGCLNASAVRLGARTAWYDWLDALLERAGDHVDPAALAPMLAYPVERVVISACEALGRCGTIQHVEALTEVERRAGVLSKTDDAARAAIRRIQARSGNVAGGRLSMAADPETGGLSRADDTAEGGLSLAEEDARRRAVSAAKAARKT